MTKLIECVPNFSEGHDMSIIKQITNEVESVEGVKLLNVDPGKATNRTVVTFVGTPSAVIDAAFLAIKKPGNFLVRGNLKENIPGWEPQMFVRLFLLQEFLWLKRLSMQRNWRSVLAKNLRSRFICMKKRSRIRPA